MDEYDFNPAAVKRRDFFRGKNLPDPPLLAVERYQEALSHFNATPPRYDLALALYDRIDDHFNPDFQTLCGQIHATPNTAFHNRGKARYFFKRAFNLSTEDSKKIRAAEYYLEQYTNEFVSTPEGFFNIPDDETAFDALVFLSQNGIEPRVFCPDDKERISPYFLASFLGAGRGVKRDDSEAHDYYKTYLSEVNQGYLGHAYRNMAIRTTLGLGVPQNLHQAHQLIRTGGIIFETRPYGTADTLMRLVSRIKEKNRTFEYAASQRRVVRQFQNKIIPWSMLEVISQTKESSTETKEAIVDTLSLFCFLSRAEQWPNHERWGQMYRYAMKTFFPHQVLETEIINPDFYLGSTVRFHAQIIEQEPDRFSIRLNRLNMYEYFRDKNLGIPPVAQKDRYELALKTPRDYGASLVLFDEDEDSHHANFLYLVGTIHDMRYGGYFDEKKALLYYRRASDLGHGGASCQIALKYEHGSIVPLNLDTAWAYFQRATKQEFDVASPTYDRVKRVITELNKLSSLPTVRQKIFSLYAYYRDSGLGEVPVSSEDRNNRAIKWTDFIPPNYEEAVKLFIEEVDCQHSNWLLLMGVIHDEHLDNPLFNPDKAVEYFKRSSALGNSAASYNLGLKYYNGKETEVDLEETKKWFRLAKEQGDVSALRILADIEMWERSLNDPEIEHYPTQNIVQAYKEASEDVYIDILDERLVIRKGDLVALNQYIQCQINGTGVEQDTC